MSNKIDIRADLADPVMLTRSAESAFESPKVAPRMNSLPNY
jgi:hypothetical protein